MEDKVKKLKDLRLKKSKIQSEINDLEKEIRDFAEDNDIDDLFTKTTTIINNYPTVINNPFQRPIEMPKSPWYGNGVMLCSSKLS